MRILKKKGEKKLWAEIMELCAIVYMAAILLLLPFYCKDGFVMIGNAKSEIFFRIVLVTAIVFALGVLLLAVDKLVGRLVHGEEIFRRISLSLTDKFVLLYGGAVVLAFCFSPYQAFALFGAVDWYMGLVTQLVMVWSYFCISRCFQGDFKIIAVLCGVSGVIFLLALLNKFAVDPLGMYRILDYWNKYHLIGTFGNMNWYCAFCCAVFPLGMYLFWILKRKWVRLLAGIYTVLAYATLLTQGSDSGYVALCAVLFAFWFLSFRDNGRMKSFLELLLLLPVSCLLLRLFYMGRKGVNYLAKDSASEAIITGSAWIWGLGICLLLYAGFRFLDKHGKIRIQDYKKVRNIITFCLGVGAIVLLVMMAVHGVNPQAFIFMNEISYLNFNDKWGTERGFLWKVVARAYYEMPFLRKLIGAGPDCFGPYMYEHYGDVLEGYLWNRWGNAAVSNAHNEWLNSLINFGAIGLIGYAGSMIGGMIRLFRERRQAPLAFGIAFCILAYMCNQTFSFQQVLAAPFFFVLLGISESMVRSRTPQKQ